MCNFNKVCMLPCNILNDNVNELNCKMYHAFVEFGPCYCLNFLYILDLIKLNYYIYDILSKILQKWLVLVSIHLIIT